MTKHGLIDAPAGAILAIVITAWWIDALANLLIRIAP